MTWPLADGGSVRGLRVGRPDRGWQGDGCLPLVQLRRLDSDLKPDPHLDQNKGLGCSVRLPGSFVVSVNIRRDQSCAQRSIRRCDRCMRVDDSPFLRTVSEVARDQPVELFVCDEFHILTMTIPLGAQGLSVRRQRTPRGARRSGWGDRRRDRLACPRRRPGLRRGRRRARGR
jgi:hypothetical protein